MSKPHNITIAVDGTAASGKGTLSRGLAQALSLAYLDTGALYRAVALSLLRQGMTPDAPPPIDVAARAALQLDFALTEDSAIRSPETSAMAAEVAAIADVRAAMLARQRGFAADIPKGKNGAILDGRDIGTVVLPQADYKFFVDADPAIRAGRRYKELVEAGYTAEIGDIEATIRERDARDKSRATAPLKKADDAIFIDTTAKSAKEVLDFALAAMDMPVSQPDGD